MRFLLALLLLSFLALTACQQHPKNFMVKDADFGTWAEFVEQWNGKVPGITGIGDPEQPVTEWRLARPAWYSNFPGYRVDFGHGAELHVFMKNDRVVRFRLMYVGEDGAGANRFIQGIEKSIVVAGIAARWDEPAVMRVADAINQAKLKDKTTIEGNYALNLTNSPELGLSLDVGRK